MPSPLPSSSTRSLLFVQSFSFTYFLGLFALSYHSFANLPIPLCAIFLLYYIILFPLASSSLRTKYSFRTVPFLDVFSSLVCTLLSKFLLYSLSPSTIPSWPSKSQSTYPIPTLPFLSSLSCFKVSIPSPSPCFISNHYRS